MKTTIEIADPLLESAKVLARRDRTTVRALVEEGLRHVVAARASKRKKPFVLRNASVRGRGLQAGVSSLEWSDIVDLANSSL